MDQEKFLNLFFSNYNRIIFGETYANFDIEQHKNLKSLTSLINYDCQFDEKGLCKQNKGTKNIMCCCGGCRSSIGFLRELFYKDIPLYAELFDEDTGFWRKDGCALPRDLRSPLCLRYNCIKNISETEMDLFSLIEDSTIEKIARKKYIQKYNLNEYTSMNSIIDHLKQRLEAK